MWLSTRFTLSHVCAPKLGPVMGANTFQPRLLCIVAERAGALAPGKARKVTG